MTGSERAGFRRAVAYVLRNKNTDEIRRDFEEMTTVVEDVKWEAMAAAETAIELEQILKMEKGV